MNNKSVEAVLGRLMVAFGANTDSKLARLMSVNRQTLSSWRQRDSVPYLNCIQISEEMGLSLDWLLKGEGSMYKATATESQPSLSPRDQGLLDLFHALDEDAQREIQSAAQEKKRVRDMETQLKELSQKLDRFNSAG